MLKKLKIILQMLSDGNYHSGAELGNKLKLTRGAIWKIIKQFKKYDIDIEAKTNLGYRIPQGLELLDKKTILQNVANKNQQYINKIEIFDELESTNTYLSDAVKTGNNNTNNVCFAEHQTVGKGRLGRSWLSPFAKNIYLSLSWQFAKPPQELSNLGLAVAVAIAEALKIYGIKEGIALKWPNDILWQNSKLAGILVELFGETHYIYNAIIGVGLNVNMPLKTGKKITQSWCDTAQITNSKPERNKLAGILLDQLLTAVSSYQDNGLKPFIKKWRGLDASYGKKVTIITPLQKINGTGLGIDENGHFLLKNSTGKIQSFASGEVSLRL